VLLQGSFYEVSLALVGVELPGLIPILEYGFADCKARWLLFLKFFDKCVVLYMFRSVLERL
jgi:hypothetical protein